MFKKWDTKSKVEAITGAVCLLGFSAFILYQGGWKSLLVELGTVLCAIALLILIKAVIDLIVWKIDGK